MCGISLFLSKNNNNIIPMIIKSINLIQNRGYDSIGIAYLDILNKKFIVKKKVNTYNEDCIKSTINLLKDNNINTNLAFAHTRWATHGSKTLENAHPHISFNNKIIIVHNGVINNYIDIKNMLIKNGYKFNGETDSEVIANLIEFNFLNNNIEKAICDSCNMLDGTYSLIISTDDDIDNIWVVRKGSPLLLANTDNLLIVTSEIGGFAGYTNNYIVINNNNLFKINKSGYIIVNNTNNNTPLLKTIDTNDKSYDSELSLNGYSYWIEKEIMEQTETINRAFNNGGRISNNMIKLGGLVNVYPLLNKNKINSILILGCGSSYYAALIGKSYFKNLLVNVYAYDACNFDIQDIPKPRDNENTIILFCSQSGETRDLYNILSYCKQYNYITIGIINQVDSLIAREVNCGIYLNAGREISVASTKSFTSTIIVLSLFAMLFSNNIKNYDKINELRSLSNIITSMLHSFSFAQKIEYIANHIVNNKFMNIFIVGKYNMCVIALEAALKFKEICYLHAEGFSNNSLKHGPFALLDNSNLTILLIDITDKDNFNSNLSAYNEIKSRTNNIIIICNSDSIFKYISDNNNILIIPKIEYYNEIMFIIALQLLTFKTSIKLGINPDKPKNLAKTICVD
tara:strand:- start:2227 stop:4110 length:1884 start_codon:yes stop_codon:yes gene_type:complete